jgi:hypothetical protein
LWTKSQTYCLTAIHADADKPPTILNHKGDSARIESVSEKNKIALIFAIIIINEYNTSTTQKLSANLLDRAAMCGEKRAH